MAVKPMKATIRAAIYLTRSILVRIAISLLVLRTLAQRPFGLFVRHRT
jgi:hypothetical protein